MSDKIDDVLIKAADFINKQDFDGAENLLQNALNVYKDSAPIHTNIGMIKILKKDIDSAIIYLEKAVELDQRLLEAYQNLGSCYLYKQDIEKAESIYLKALQIDSNNFNTYHNLATLYVQTDQLAKAKKSLEKLIQIQDENPQVSFMLGMVYFSLKEYYPAIANLLYTLSQDPSFDNARVALADAYYRLGRYNMSLKEYQTLMTTKPELITPYIRSGLILVELGYHDDALLILQKATNIDRSNVELLEILAILHEERGEKEKAEEFYQEILLLDPLHKSANEGLKRIEDLVI